MEHDCVIREANKESVFTLSVDASNEIQGVPMWMESGCAVWAYTTYGCVCLKKQSNSFEYIGTTGWHLQLQGMQEQYCEYIACACIQMF